MSNDSEFYERPQEIGGHPHQRLTGAESVDFVYPDEAEDENSLERILESLSADSISVAEAKTRIVGLQLETFGGWLGRILAGWREAAARSPVAAAAIRAMGLHGAQTIREAAEEIGCAPSLISRHQKRLEEAVGGEGVNKLR